MIRAAIVSVTASWSRSPGTTRLLQEQIDSGLLTKEAAKRSQNKNLVTRALGIEPAVEAEIHTYPAQEGDIYLICSDGLNDMVEDEDIETDARRARRQSAACRRATGSDGERQRRAR